MIRNKNLKMCKKILKKIAVKLILFILLLINFEERLEKMKYDKKIRTVCNNKLKYFLNVISSI